MTWFSLAVGAALFLLLGAIFLLAPASRTLARLMRTLNRSRRSLCEDALKHLVQCEEKSEPATLESIAGALNISTTRGAHVAEDLVREGQADFQANALILTPEGRRAALRITRAHRLLEEYYARETGIAETEWHLMADLREHDTTPEQADELERRLGRPLFDPHGDPIPGGSGELVARRGILLSDAPVGSTCTITHIEDEPETIYQDIVRCELAVGLPLVVLSHSADGLLVRRAGREIVIPRSSAWNITVTPQPEEVAADECIDTLDRLRPGESAVIAAISPICRGRERRRLLDLGLMPGTTIRSELQSPLGDPTAYRVRGAVLALRSDTARFISINRCAAESEGAN